MDTVFLGLAGLLLGISGFSCVGCLVCIVKVCSVYYSSCAMCVVQCVQCVLFKGCSLLILYMDKTICKTQQLYISKCLTVFLGQIPRYM